MTLTAKKPTEAELEILRALWAKGTATVRDLHASYDLPKDGWQVFANVINLFDAKAPYDPTTYGGFNYNPAWANAGIYGTTINIGIQAKF